MTTLVMAAILLFGIVGYRTLPVSDLPSVDYPTINVSASLPGASPSTMASSVATPLEKQFSTIAGIDSMSSVSSLGNSQITIQFSLSRDIDAAAQDVQAAIAKASRQLPPNMPTPPTYSKVNPADSPVLFLAFSSATLPLSTVDEYGETLMAQRISMINGVAQVNVYGSQQYAVRVQLNPNKLAAYGLGIDEVSDAIQAGNVNLPTGTLYGKHQAFTVLANGQLNKAADFRPMIVAYRNGNPIRLEQLGRVVDSVQNDKVASWYNNVRAVVLSIQRQPGANTVQVVDDIKKILPVLRKEIPAAVDVEVLYDRSQSIRESVNDVQFTLLLTVCLVVLVIFLFLRNLSATIIPSLALPMSIIGTFAVMSLLGYSLDNLSLMALTLSVGFVVDDAIVMLENIVRHIENGEQPFEAALKGSREIGFTIISMTLSLAAVFIPILFMSGILGRLLHEFAVTIATAVLVSGFVSLTLTPMLTSRFVRSAHSKKHNRVYDASERFFDGMLNLYDRTLKVVMRHRFITLTVAFAVAVATGVLAYKIPTGFFPSEDTGQIRASTEAAQDVSFESMREHQVAVAKIVGEDTNVDGFMSAIGAGGNGGTGNNGRMFIRLKPRSERNVSADQVIQELRKKVAGVPGMNTYFVNPPVITVGGQQSKAFYQYSLQHTDIKVLAEWAPQMMQKISQIPGVQDVTSDLLLKNPQVNVEIDRDKAASLHVTPNQIESALYDAYGGRQISTIYTDVDEYWVLMEVEPQFQTDPSSLSGLYIRSSTGQLVPIGSVAKLVRSIGPTTISHIGQLPSVTISFNLAPGYSLSTTVDAVDRIKREIPGFPDTITGSFQGTAQVYQSSLKGLIALLVVAILVIYIILGILYESFIHPITILSGLPSAGFGALLTLMIFGLDLNIYAFVGLIMLVGIVKKNAIMMIDFALDAERQGKTPAEAIYQGCLLRFRPIMMTTMAALMGTLPIALGIGAGGESRRPLGLAVVGGLIVSQMLTLYITPVIYLYMESFQQWIRRHLPHRHAKKASAPGNAPA
jgi:hydrophobic/amphiphilic exporter-1 (mainly G- bacteria), HAE1 family